MFENEAKGWHGSYSSIGRISAEKFPMILIKDQILEGRNKKKKIKDFFSPEEDLINNKIIIDEGEDIFNILHKSKIKLYKRKKEICKGNTKKDVPEEYKYHNLHHKDLLNFNRRLKYQSNLSSTIYDPKKDFVWSKTLSGPQWDSICGRNRESDCKPKIEAINLKNNKKYLKNIFKNYTNSFYSLKRGVPMEKMTQRGMIPVHYDLRIRNDKPFIITDNTMNPIKLNSITSKTEISLNKTSDQTKYNNSSKSNKLKKNAYSSPEINHSINFAKSLSREQYNYATRNREGVRPFFNPKYNLVEPRSLTMVLYNKKTKGKSTPRRLVGIDSNLFYDPDKIINKINNHKENSAPNFKYMLNKNEENGKFPLHMHNLYNRGSLEIITEKGLKMNNFAETDSKIDISTFCPKKSFNKIINYSLLKNEKINGNLEKLIKKFSSNQKIKNLMEFYTKNLDDDKIQFTGNKFDSVTLKSIKPIGELTQREKELFNLNFLN